ncbi:MAG: type III pantothenate kinase [Bifidobacteriaceae bacterium]|jgi:type III pantothenate kinase|nr:type III pantothenate kinase [Bifidobacteriaceae bacterium]MCI1915409.1 type III pantothenate kinase [Bifidobacteriaceae bacterium]
MLLAIDIGNTNIGIGFMENGDVAHSFRLMTTSHRTSDEFAVMLSTFISQAKLTPSDFDSAVVSSVVPTLTARVTAAVEQVTGVVSHVVHPRYAESYGIHLTVNEPLSVGADILVDCVGAHALYEGPTLVVDCGTATKYIYVDETGTFSTLAIGVGFEAGTHALTDRTAQLPQIELRDPGTVLGTTTLSAMQAGLYYGFLGGIDFTLRQFLHELDERPRIITTGGLGGVFTPALDLVDFYDPDLLYKGLGVIDHRLRGE